MKGKTSRQSSFIKVEKYAVCYIFLPVVAKVAQYPTRDGIISVGKKSYE